jgi:toxin FitB
MQLYGDHVIPVTANAAPLWGPLSDKPGNDGADLLIAATALASGMTVVARNVKHFAPTGVRVFNPFEDSIS